MKANVNYRQLHRHCPACRTELTQIGDDRGDTQPWFSCAECAGLWLSHDEFFAHFHRAQPGREITELLVHNDGSTPRPCPTCAEPMEIAWLDFMQLDQCPDHGIWFDDGDLDRALANATGLEQIKGLARAARAERVKATKAPG